MSTFGDGRAEWKQALSVLEREFLIRRIWLRLQICIFEGHLIFANFYRCFSPFLNRPSTFDLIHMQRNPHKFPYNFANFKSAFNGLKILPNIFQIKKSGCCFKWKLYESVNELKTVSKYFENDCGTFFDQICR